MSNCSNCFNNCGQTLTSDKCVKYTGVNVEMLGIENGDSLSYVIQALTGFLTSVLDGTGVIPPVSSDVICDLVTGYLPTCGDITIVDITSALIKASCDLQNQITVLSEKVATIESDYDVSCLPNITGDLGTHSILQSVIALVCQTKETVTVLTLSLPIEYVKAGELNDLVDTHLEDSSTLVSNKMIPYAAVEYYGPLSYFDPTGAGIGSWAKIYLCNGNNGTPDKRGRVPVGTTTGMGGGLFSATVDPAISGNPNYLLQTTGGANNILLSGSHMPIHTHIVSTTITDNHYHYEFGNIAQADGDPTTNNYPCRLQEWGGSNSFNFRMGASTTPATIGKSSNSINPITAATTISDTGGGLAHSNIQPVLACHYIIHIP